MEPNALLFANCHSCKHQSPVVLVCDRCPLSFCEFHLRTWFHFTPNDNGVWPCPRCYGRCDCNKCLAYYATYGVLEDDHLEVEDDDDDDDDASDEEDDDEDNDDHEHVDVVAETNSHQEEEEEEDDDDDDGAPEEEEETHLTCGPGDDGDGDDGDSRDDAKVLELQQVIDLERQFAVKYTALEATCSSQMDRIYRLEEDLAAVNQKFSVVTQNLQMANLTLEKKIQRFNDYKEKLREKDTQLLDAEKLRKKLHNTILELKGNIRVYVRVRPLLPDDGPGARITYPTSAGLAGRGITLTQSGVEHPFAFDQVFNDTASQQDVFKEISELIQSSVDGYRVCIFSYGQTGSGKSHTMMGRPESPFEKGLIPRSIEQVFITTEALVSQGWKYKLEASLLEIYNENIRDLLAIKRNVKQPEYKISHLEGNTHVSNLTVVSVDSYEKVSFLIQEAVQYRSVASTDMNQQSSRSHFVFTLRINGVNERTGKGLHGVLNLIDLAGSERLSRSGATGARLLETQYINTSLSALTDVILALTRKESHIPVRNSKLTYLLQNSLSSKSKALMFVNLSPALSSISESLCSLRFAARANQCQL